MTVYDIAKYDGLPLIGKCLCDPCAQGVCLNKNIKSVVKSEDGQVAGFCLGCGDLVGDTLVIGSRQKH